MFRMLKILFAIPLALMLLIGGAGAAYAAEPPADTTLTYQRGDVMNTVVLNSNLSASEKKTITEYDIRVEIVGQAPRVLTVTKLPAMLFNIQTGTRLHAYLTLKGDFGTSKEFDSGTYVQGAATQTPTNPVSPDPTTTATHKPATSSPVPSASATSAVPGITTSTSAKPVPSTQPAQTLGEATDLVDFTQDHMLAVTIIAVITFLLLGALALVWRRRN